jgi:hypothetical protein
MLKTVSSIVNAIGALNYKGTWNASTNTPALASGVGTKGDYYVVSVAGTTTLDGISNWGVGDWVTFNGSVWQRVEGGADLNGVNLSVSGTSTLSGLTASTALALNANKEVVSVTNTGTGDNVLATTPTLVGDVTLSTGNLVIGTSGKGIDFSATPNTGTSELLADYEEGAWTPVLSDGTNDATMTVDTQGRYTKIGRAVYITGTVATSSLGSVSGNIRVTGLPYTANINIAPSAFASSGNQQLNVTAGQYPSGRVIGGTSYIELWLTDSADGMTRMQASAWSADGYANFAGFYFV